MLPALLVFACCPSAYRQGLTDWLTDSLFQGLFTSPTYPRAYPFIGCTGEGPLTATFFKKKTLGTTAGASLPLVYEISDVVGHGGFTTMPTGCADSTRISI